MGGKKKDWILFVFIFIALILSTVPALLRYFKTEPESRFWVIVEGGKGEIMRVPLDEDARYVIKDGAAEKADGSVTLDSLGEEAYPSKHDVNILEIKDNAVSCIESNCSNQVCVSMGQLTNASYDIPIVCLPHGIVIVIEES